MRCPKFVQPWAINWAHVKATCESGGLTKDICKDYGLELHLGDTNPTLPISVVAPPDTASNIVLREGETTVAPWTLFHVTYGKATTVQETAEWAPRQYQEEDAPRARSPPKEEKEDYWSRGRSGH